MHTIAHAMAAAVSNADQLLGRRDNGTDRQFHIIGTPRLD
jgi:hypothetical protein